MSRVFTNDPGDRGSIPGQVIPMSPKMVLDTSLHCNECIKGKVAQHRERSSVLPYTSL